MAYQIKAPGLRNTRDYARGLFFSNAYGVRKNLVFMVRNLASGFVRVGPEDETEYSVNAPQLRPNSDVSSITARLDVKRLPRETPPVSSDVVVEGPDGRQNYALESSGGVVAENIEIRLDGGEVFWQLASTGKATRFAIPNFAEEVNNYLNRLDASLGQVQLKFLVKAAVPVEIKISLEDVESSSIVTQIWENPLDQTYRQDRNIDVTYGETRMEPELDVLPSGASLTRIELDVSGEFEEPRVLGSIETHDGRSFSTVNSEFSIAQQFENEFKTQITGICLHVLVENEAEIFLAIHADDSGAPLPDAMASTTLIIEPEEEINSTWWTGMLDAPLDVEGNTNYWLVIKGVRGDASISVGSQQWSTLGEFRINRGGQLWKPINDASDISALIRPIYLPDVDHQTAAIEIEVRGSNGILAAQRIDPAADSERMSIPITGEGIQAASLVIKSSVSGLLKLSNIVQRYTQ